MPVKPLDTVPDWGSAGNYPASLYPVNLPWNDPNPVGGLPTPWSGQPRLNATAFTSFANNGFSPQIPTDASSMNEWDRRIGVYVNWVILGTSAADADAHIMETNGAGLSSALAYEATASFQGVGGTPAPLANGAVVTTGKVLLLSGTADLTGTKDSVASIGSIEFLSGGAAPSTNGLFVSSLGEIFQGPSQRVHVSPNGVVYATGDQEADTGNLALIQVATTTVAVVGRGSGSVRVIVEGQIQVDVLPQTITIDVQEDQSASPAFTDIGAAQLVKAQKTAADATDWQPFRHERIYASGTTIPTKYRVSIDPGASLGRVKEVRLRVVGERG